MKELFHVGIPNHSLQECHVSLVHQIYLYTATKYYKKKIDKQKVEDKKLHTDCDFGPVPILV